jgi:hypothetical protein
LDATEWGEPRDSISYYQRPRDRYERVALPQFYSAVRRKLENRAHATVLHCTVQHWARGVDKHSTCRSLHPGRPACSAQKATQSVTMSEYAVVDFTFSRHVVTSASAVQPCRVLRMFKTFNVYCDRHLQRDCQLTHSEEGAGKVSRNILTALTWSPTERGEVNIVGSQMLTCHFLRWQSGWGRGALVSQGAPFSLPQGQQWLPRSHRSKGMASVSAGVTLGSRHVVILAAS